MGRSTASAKDIRKVFEEEVRVRNTDQGLSVEGRDLYRMVLTLARKLEQHEEILGKIVQQITRSEKQ